MINILGFTRGTAKDEMDGPQYYRTYLPLRQVHRADNGIEAHIVTADKVIGIPNERLETTDIFVMTRMYHENIDPFIDVIHSYGAVLVLDTDDDLTENYKLVSGTGDVFKEIIGQVDYLTVSTEPLADLYAPYTKERPIVLPNHVDALWMQSVASKAKRIVEGMTMGVSGSPTHWGDWRVVARPLQRIAKDYDVTPILSGDMPSYMRFVADEEDRVELGGVPYSVYPVILKQFDAVLCAVDSTDHFNDGKSAVKALECMALGVVPICSQFKPYMELAEAGAPVYIVDEDTPEAWYEAMESFIKDKEMFNMYRDAGPEWVMNNRDMANCGEDKWSKFYSSIVDRLDK